MHKAQQTSRQLPALRHAWLPTWLPALLVAMAMSCLLISCSKTDETPPPAVESHASNRPTTQPAAESSTPVTSRQLPAFTGNWFCTTPGNFIGLSFLPAKKVRVTDTLQNALDHTGGSMLDYELLDDGRLLLIDAQGNGQIFNIKQTASELVLQNASGISSRYTRLPAGTSIHQAAAAWWQTQKTDHAVRTLAVKKFLTRPGLLLSLRSADGKTLQNLALELDPSTVTTSNDSYTGSAWYDTQPPVVAKFKMTLASVDHALSHRVLIHLGPVTAQANPAVNAPALLGDFTLDVQGSNDQLHLSSPVSSTQVPQASQGPAQPSIVTLWHDLPLRDVIIKRFKEESVRVQAMQLAIADALKDFAILKGTSAWPSPSAADTDKNASPGSPPATNTLQPASTTGRTLAVSHDRIILLRDTTSQTPRWRGEIRITPPWSNSQNSKAGDPPFSQSLRFTYASIEIKNDVAMLVIPVGSRVYQYLLQGSFVGSWSNPGSPVTYPSQMQIEQASDMATYLADLRAQRDKLASVSPENELMGFVPVEEQHNDNAPAIRATLSRTPVILRLSLNEDGSVSAQAYYSLFRTLVLMKGSVQPGLLGPTIELSFDQIPRNQKNVRLPAALLELKLRQLKWHLKLADTGPVLRFQGQIINTPQSNFTLEHASDLWKTRHHAMLNQMLVPGCKLLITLPRPVAGSAPALLTLTLDQTTHKITGQLHGQLTNQLANQLPSQPAAQADAPAQPVPAVQKPVAVTGEVTSQGPWPGVSLHLTQRGRAFTIDLLVFEKQNQPALLGVFYPDKASQSETHIQLEQVAR